MQLDVVGALEVLGAQPAPKSRSRGRERGTARFGWATAAP